MPASQAGKGKEGESGWNVSGYNYNKDREQIVRATVGAGDITVRDDAKTGGDSTAGLNRDVSKAYEITRDDEHRTDLYVSSLSIDLVTHPLQTLKRWKDAALNFDQVIKSRIEEVTTSADRLWGEIQAQRVTIDEIPEASRKVLGDQRALDMGKNLVRAGLDPVLLDTLPSTFKTDLNDWANGAAGTCPVTTNSGGQLNEADPSSGTAITLDPTVTQSVTPYMALFLTRTSDLIQEINKLPVQEAQVAMLAMQSAMGLAKAALSITLNALAHAAFGEQYEKLKEELAITFTAELTESERKQIQDAHDDAKRLYASSDHSVFQLDGDSQVVATEFLIDLVGGGLRSLGGKATGKVITVAGEKVQSGSLKPEWLRRLQAGNDFNKVREKEYPYNELYIQRADGKGYYRVVRTVLNLVRLFRGSIHSFQRSLRRQL
jgi:filamentous hemagglutinin